jgi:hypothetical protein
VLIASQVGGNCVIRHRPVPGIIHTEHYGHYSRLARKHVTPEALVNVPSEAPTDFVAPNPGTIELNMHLRKPCNSIKVNQRSVISLFRNAIAIKDDSISIVEIVCPFLPIGLCRRNTNETKNEDYTSEPAYRIHGVLPPESRQDPKPQFEEGSQFFA